MKILILNDYAQAVGGAEILAYELRDELRRRSHDARVFASRALGIGAADYTCFGSVSRLRTLHRTANPRAWGELRRVLRAFRPDVVHVRMFTTQLSPLILPLLRDVPCLYHAVWYEVICPTGKKLLPDGTICRAPAGRACRRCLSPPAWSALMVQRRLIQHWRGAFDVVVANSEITRRRLEAEGMGPALAIPNGVARRPARPPLADPPLVAYAGRLSPEKGVTTLIEAFGTVARRIPGARLLVLGDGPERGRLERLTAAGLADRVTWTGHVAREEVERRLDEAWVQVLPSVYEEPFGLAVAEALMRGTAVVATARGWPAEMVGRSGGGLLVPPRDPAALARALGDLLQDRGRAESLGAAGRAWAFDELSIETCVDRFEDLYRELVAKAAA